jgi:hypothetical protein
MERTNELLHYDKLSCVHRKIMDIPTSFIWIIILFDGAFEYGAVFRNYEVKLGQTLNYFV